MSEYPNQKRIARYEEALRTGLITFIEEEGQGSYVAGDLDAPLLLELESDWPDSFEREAALWRIAREVVAPGQDGVSDR